MKTTGSKKNVKTNFKQFIELSVGSTAIKKLCKTQKIKKKVPNVRKCLPFMLFLPTTPINSIDMRVIIKISCIERKSINLASLNGAVKKMPKNKIFVNENPKP
jgi:hypothetical protein